MASKSADHTKQVNTWADKIMSKIDADIARGRVSADVATFSELHDYVDANGYLLEVVPDTGDWDSWNANQNDAADEVSRRLVARREARS